MRFSDSNRLSRARRRQVKPRVRSVPSGEFEALLSEVKRKVIPELADYFYVFVSGLLVGAGLRFNQPVLLIAGVLIAPRLIPIPGLAFAAAVGMLGLFLQMLFSLAVLLLLFSLGAGLSASAGPVSTMTFADLSQYGALNLFNFGFVIIGAILFAYKLAHEGEVKALPSAALAYGLLLPLGALVFALFHLDESQSAAAMLTFGLHLTWAFVAALSVWLAKGLRAVPRSASAYLMTILLLSLVLISGMLSLGASILVVMPQPSPTLTPTFSATPSPTSSATPTVTFTQPPSPIASATQPPQPTVTSTPGRGIIIGTGGVGVILREYPNGPSLGGLFDDAIVDVIGGPVQVEEVSWWKVRTRLGEEGWVLGNFLATATP